MPTVTYTTYTPEQLHGLDRNALIHAWNESKQAADQAVYQERNLRQLLFAKAVPDPKVGVNNVDLDGTGWLLQATHNINWSVANTEEMTAELLKMSDDQASRLVKWKPELSVSEWKKFQVDYPNTAKDFAQFVTSKPGLPTLKLIAPGDEGNKR